MMASPGEAVSVLQGLLRIRSLMTLWAAFAVVIVAAIIVPDILPWVDNYPKEWMAPFRNWAEDFLFWLVKKLDFGLFTFKEFTRGLTWLMNWPFKFANWTLWKGFEVTETFYIPSLPWMAIVICAGLIGHRAGGWRLSLLAAGGVFYLALFGQWENAMKTLSSIIIAVPIACGIGLIVGIWSYRDRRVEKAITPVLDFMQTVPVFAYLVPILYLFGFGPIPAMIVTVIYAIPPMVRATLLGLKMVSPEVIEFGQMAGCSQRQLMWRVMLPSARPTLLLGINQVIMLSLNLAILASMIGAGGLGFEVYSALKSLNVGRGLEAGVAIVLLAIVLDRVTQALAQRQPPEHTEIKKNFVFRHPYLLASLVFLFGLLLLSYVVPEIRNVPEDMTVTTAPYWRELVNWITVNLFDYLYAAKSFLLVEILIPFKRFLLVVPWFVVVALFGIIGWRLGGWKLSAIVGGMILFIVVSGFWDRAMVTVYLMTISVLIAAAIGMPLGILAARNERMHRFFGVFTDTLQTLPSFVYLVPVVMLFQVGDVSAMIAVIVYAIAPAIRYTDHGIRGVSPELIEAARATGCSRRQILWKVQIPLALPEIMLGLNQTIMLAISMLVITALVGTTDLGMEVYIGLSNADPGRGIIAGICVAFIAIIADRLIQAWSRKHKERLGLA